MRRVRGSSLKPADMYCLLFFGTLSSCLGTSSEERLGRLLKGVWALVVLVIIHKSAGSRVQHEYYIRSELTAKLADVFRFKEV